MNCIKNYKYLNAVHIYTRSVKLSRDNLLLAFYLAEGTYTVLGWNLIR